MEARVRNLARGTAILSFLLLATAWPAYAEERSYDVPAFTGVDVSSGLSAIVSVGSTQSVSAEAPNAAALDRLKVDVSEGTLHLAIEGNFVGWFFTFGQSKPLLVRVTLPSLENVAASAGASVDVTQASGRTLAMSASSGASMSAKIGTVDRLSLDVSSGARVRVQGSCNQLIANASSGGALEAHDLACGEVTVTASSGASARVNALKSVNADASVGASISISGRPERASSNSSVGGSVSFAP
jgi:hypothetical protein